MRMGRGPLPPRSRIIGSHGETSDVPFHRKYSCATCSITFYVQDGGNKACPLCEARKEAAKYRDMNQKLANELALVGQQHDALSVQVNNLDAMKQGLTLMSKEDFAWIKSVCYINRQEPGSIILTAQKTKHGWAFYKRDARNRAIPEEHVMTSIGGSSLAMAYVHTHKMTDNTKALEMLMRAMAWHLAQAEA